MPDTSIKDVIQSGVCVGCGSCSAATHGRIQVRPNEWGVQQASINSATLPDIEIASRVCPFADNAVDEDKLAAELFDADIPRDKRLGAALGIYAGRVVAGEDTTLSSSGGLTSWLTLQLLERGLVDGVIHVGTGDSSDTGSLFEYTVSTSLEQLRQRRKSQYYSTSFADVVSQIRGDGKRYALVGVPCFVKAARLLAREDATFGSQLAVCIGLVCGHLKSSGFAELLAWQIGVPPPVLGRVDFRVKTPGNSASDYNFSAWPRGSAKPVTGLTRDLVGGNWGHAMFQLKACDYCDDVFAETADIAFGDAWLPQYASDWRGTNVAVTRNALLDAILKEGAARGDLMLEPLSADLAAMSQAGNYRHRWDGLSVRLADDNAAGRWSPRKRVAPGSCPVSPSRARIVRLRRHLAELSHRAFQEAKKLNSLDHFLRIVAPLTKEMQFAQIAEGPSSLRNFARRLKWIVLYAFK
jgi:coenzyme F420 hydrogenase subunit beta